MCGAEKFKEGMMTAQHGVGYLENEDSARGIWKRLKYIRKVIVLRCTGCSYLFNFAADPQAS